MRKVVCRGHVNLLKTIEDSWEFGKMELSLNETNGESLKQKLEKYLELVPCKTCAGKRLRPEALAVKVGPYAITDLTSIKWSEKISPNVHQYCLIDLECNS